MKPALIEKVKWKLSSLGQVAFPGVVVIGLIILVRLSGAMQPLELFLFDRFMRLRPAEPIDDRVVVIGIDETDIRNVGYPVPDAELTRLITRLESYQPRAIGLDIFRDLQVEPGGDLLAALFRDQESLIGVERAILPGEIVNPPPSLPQDRIGFVDVIQDFDGHVRRVLVAGFPRYDTEQYHFALGVKMAEWYLWEEGIEVSNGIRDPGSIMFKDTEFSSFQTHDGGYVGADAGANQVLMNWRSGTGFKVFSMADVVNGNVDAQLIEGKIVVIGMTAASVEDVVTVPAISDEFIDGVMIHAHTASYVISAVLNGRPQLRVLPELWEYLLIVAIGGLGIAIAVVWRSPLLTFLTLGIAAMGIVAISYGLLILGLWLPVAPIVMAWVVAGFVSRYVQELQSLIAKSQQLLEQRERTIDEAFSALHNGPLQTLAMIQSKLTASELEPDDIAEKLNNLDRELRQVYESIRPDTIAKQASAPLHELLYQIYHKTMQRDFAGFNQLKLRIPDIHPMDDFYLDAEDKHEICDFLEEALCNVGKHAVGATRLRVTCKQDQGICLIRVTDNGPGLKSNHPGNVVKEQGGSKQARRLAKKLGGTFKRSANSPQGTICELEWRLAVSAKN